MNKIRQNKKNKKAIDDSEIAENYRSFRRKFLLSRKRSPIKITRMFLYVSVVTNGCLQIFTNRCTAKKPSNIKS